MQTQQVVKAAGDVTAYGTAIATLVGWLPHIAALFSVIWLAIQITEKVTGKAFHEIVRCLCRRVREAAIQVWDILRG
jgi:hypothetical protein